MRNAQRDDEHAGDSTTNSVTNIAHYLAHTTALHAEPFDKNVDWASRAAGYKPVTWTDLATNTALLGVNGGLQKIGDSSSGWNGGASSTDRIYANDSEQGIKFKCVGPAPGGGAFGLSTVHANPINWNAGNNWVIDFGLHCSGHWAGSGKLTVMEGNQWRTVTGDNSWTVDTVAEIKVDGNGVVTYWKDGEKFYTSHKSAVFPLEVDALLNAKGATQVSVLAQPKPVTWARGSAGQTCDSV